MQQVTVRQVQEQCLVEAKKRARSRGVSMNTILREVLEAGLGIHRIAPTNGLERFAGDSDFGPEWDARMSELSQIDEEGWK